ncbi:hypothetical protein HAX54_053157 [Datura stramonium]|uniref:tRNA-guanine(15) transglycosylase-like domain-containing protein n=1 Tax=Datura stramonium TaxID=4076 RepID=A0ABS8T0H3_DATST|nr:hypothetical protein [Datura stramonium]
MVEDHRRGFRSPEGTSKSLEGISLKAISNIGGLHPLLGLRDHILVAVPRDSIISIPDHDSTNRLGASFETPCGRMLIKPAEYMEMISSMRPNLWATLADEVPAWASEKRNKASVERTLKWLDECITSNTIKFENLLKIVKRCTGYCWLIEDFQEDILHIKIYSNISRKIFFVSRFDPLRS